jgi:hypothetical protein
MIGTKLGPGDESTATGFPAGVIASAGTSGAAVAEAAERFDKLAPVNARQRVLLRGGTIISLDLRIGDLANGDVLIERRKISEVFANVATAGAQRIDTGNMILFRDRGTRGTARISDVCKWRCITSAA